MAAHLSLPLSSVPVTSAPVGRAREMGLFDKVASASESGPQFVAVAGDPGLGKTHLLTAVHRRCAGAGWQVVSGRAGGSGAEEPYGLLADALDGVPGALLDSARARLTGQELDLLTVVVPALGGTTAGPPDGYRLGRGLRSLLELLAASVPLLVLLDDVHHADPASVQVLDFLLHHPPRGQLVIAAAYRPRQAVGLPWQASATHGALPVWLIAPRPLGPDELDALMPPDTTSAHRATLRDASAGNPGVLRALLRSRPAVPGRSYGAEELRTGIPPVVPGPFPAESHGLTPLARLVAQAAAVIGSHFEPESLAAVAQLDETSVLVGMDELLADDLLRADAGWRRFGFRDVAVRAGFYHASGGGWRCAAHGRATAALSGRGAPAARGDHRVEPTAAIGGTGGTVLAPRFPDGAGTWEGPPVGTLPGSALGLLSNRETEIARLVSEGMTNQQIATRLAISPKTVETYLARVFKKLQVISRTQVAHLVGRAGSGLSSAGPRTMPPLAG